MQLQTIQTKIYELRGQKVMLDFDLAELYETETKRLKEAVKRNNKRFPDDFMFELTKLEYDSLRTQFASLEKGRGKYTKYLPYAFTEQGIAMLSGVLRSEKAVQMNIAIMRAFVAVRKIVLLQHDMKGQLKLIKDRIEEHDMQLSQIYDAIENMLDEKAGQRKWDDRERIGFKK